MARGRQGCYVEGWQVWWEINTLVFASQSEPGGGGELWMGDVVDSKESAFRTRILLSLCRENPRQILQKKQRNRKCGGTDMLAFSLKKNITLVPQTPQIILTYKMMNHIAKTQW